MFAAELLDVVVDEETLLDDDVDPIDGVDDRERRVESEERLDGDNTDNIVSSLSH